MISPARFAGRALLCGACCAAFSCGERVLVARIGTEQRAQFDSVPSPEATSADAGPESAALDAGRTSPHDDAEPDAAADSGSKDDGKHDDDDDHDKDHD